MITHDPGAIRVAALLVSASCGIAFLLGSGEMAVHAGMAGSLYAIVTAFGMFALALSAQKLWHGGMPIWAILGNQYGTVVRKGVALLSLLWMSGVLAAQIHGGVAVLSTAGLTTAPSVLITAVAVLAMSSLDLGVAALLFAVGLLASNVVLLHALVASGGLPVYLHAWPSFIREMQGASGIDTFADVIAVGFLVITGSDYQQFVIAARRPLDACLGCALAGVFLIAVGFLPAATVVAALHSGQLSGLTDDAGAIPWIALHSNAHLGPFCLGMIMLAALGSGTAVTRAMTSALLDLPPFIVRHAITARLLVVVTCSVIAIDGRSIVSTVISLNMVYISAVGILFALDQTGHAVMPRCAFEMMIAGTVSSLLATALVWVHITDVPDWIPLTVGLTASACPLLARSLACGPWRLRR
ncbi:sodium:solute symporter [Burkholderia multivorans]|uniref:sodium:solute symporter n=1 Tax=Burkholderia multivorans TaxID=87883 RepID=UPI001C22FF3D|nr:sodium:solute symporter [Burkholderia multivorans]MBU9363467.1 sodium:solute symporter [Burkholderia multivorans]